MNKNQELLKDFTEYCKAHPEERFWQSLRGWSGLSFGQALYTLKKERGERCIECLKPEVKYRQFSPDIGGLQFCSMGCYHEFGLSNTYRSCPIEEIKE